MTEADPFSRSVGGRSARSCVPLRCPRAGQKPMKAVLTDERFCDPDWIFERKLDGIRCIAIRAGGRRPAALAQRPLARTTATPRSPRRSRREPADALRRRRRGRRVRGRADELRAPRPAQAAAACAVFFYVFDLLWLDGHDVRRAAAARRASGCCATRSRFAGPDPPDAASQRRRRGALRRGVPQGLGGPDRQARRQPVRAPRARATGSSSSASTARSS